MNIAQLRIEYQRAELDEEHSEADPVQQFTRWWSEAQAGKVREANAMTLATADAGGRPAARTVLLKSFDDNGFVFFTNYESRKGAELAANPHACLLFFWPELERQVRVEGDVTRVGESESNAYFASRPVASRLGAWASPQSKVISGKAWLLAQAAKMAVVHGPNPTRPPHWGGYVVRPIAIEFWQGRPSRLHDRLLYARGVASWDRVRLAP